MVTANGGIRDGLVPENPATIAGLVAFPAKKAA